MLHEFSIEILTRQRKARLRSEITQIFDPIKCVKLQNHTRARVLDEKRKLSFIWCIARLNGY